MPRQNSLASTERLTSTDAVDGPALIYSRSMRDGSARSARNWTRVKHNPSSRDAAYRVINVLAVHHGICAVRGYYHETRYEKGK